MSLSAYHRAIRPRRPFVSGGSALTKNAALLWTELGKLLAKEDGLVVVTGGTKGRRDSPDSIAADWAVAQGMISSLKDERNLEKHLETVLPGTDWRNLRRFKKGRVLTVQNRSSQSRRFTLVDSTDVVISIEGKEGTRSVLDMALAIEKPMLPLPFGEGVSALCWMKHQREIEHWFQIAPSEARALQRIILSDLDREEIKELAQRIKGHLMKGFTRNCFVMMRFRKPSDAIYEKAIRPALEACGLNPVRTDRLVLTGNMVECIHRALRNCHIGIADTTGNSPNVLYEIGMAHAEHKPVILLRRTGKIGMISGVPFDIATESILPYEGSKLLKLRKLLIRAIAVILGKISRNNW